MGTQNISLWLLRMKLYPDPTDQVADYLKEKYENEAGKFWDIFYKRNGTKFFKDRHYLDREFPELIAGACSILEIGCGVGNAVYPILEANPLSTIYAVDFSKNAIDLLRQHENYDASRIHAHVLDIVKDSLTSIAEPASIDFCTAVFALSAISPGMILKALKNIASVLKPGSGKVLFRDYAVGDLAEERLQRKGRQKKLEDNFYVRGDGTRCLYFSEDYVKSLFEDAGFICEHIFIHERDIENKGKSIVMNRRWIQAEFKLACSSDCKSESSNS